jgi:cytochrome c-type biogenesis protein CcmH
VRKVVLALAFLALVWPAPALPASRCSLTQLEGQVMCPTCNTTLDQSNAPVAERMRRYILTWSAQGLTCDAIKGRLAAQFGPRVLAAPPRHGFGLLAWLLPLVGLGIGTLVVAALAWRWSRRRSDEVEAAGEEPEARPELNGRIRLDPELERRLDDELARFDG